jgi:hypothetical protein
MLASAEHVRNVNDRRMWSLLSVNYDSSACLFYIFFRLTLWRYELTSQSKEIQKKHASKKEICSFNNVYFAKINVYLFNENFANIFDD